MIPLQICMYVLILFTYNSLRIWKISWWLLLLGGLVAVNVASPYIMQALPDVAGKLYFCSPFPYAYIFYVGMFLYVFRGRMLPLLVRYFWWLLAVYLFWVYGNRNLFHLDSGCTSIQPKDFWSAC